MTAAGVSRCHEAGLGTGVRRIYGVDMLLKRNWRVRRNAFEIAREREATAVKGAGVEGFVGE